MDVRYRRGPDVVYRNGGYLVTNVLAGVSWIVFSVVVTDVEWALVALLVVPAEIYANLRLRVVLGDTRLDIHHLLSAELIPYEAITAVRFTGRHAGHKSLEIYLTDGSRIGVHRNRSSFFPFHEPGWQRPLADEIMERVDQARSNTATVEQPTSPLEVTVSGTSRKKRHRESSSDRERQDRARLMFAVATGVAAWVLVVAVFVDRPLAFLGGCAWFVATALTVTFAVRYTWQQVLTRIPARYAESPSKSVRILTAVAKVVAIYAVVLLALVAALDVPTFVMEHL